MGHASRFGIDYAVLYRIVEECSRSVVPDKAWSATDWINEAAMNSNMEIV
jgi:hypothetical protein